MRKGTKGMLGEKLMTLRKKSGYSQQELADRLKVSRQTISNWELNQGAPSIDKAKELADIYKISLDDLVGDEVEVVARKKREPDLHVLKKLVGKMVKLECSDIDLVLEEGKSKSVGSRWRMAACGIPKNKGEEYFSERESG